MGYGDQGSQLYGAYLQPVTSLLRRVDLCLRSFCLRWPDRTLGDSLNDIMIRVQALLISSAVAPDAYLEELGMCRISLFSCGRNDILPTGLR